MTKVKVSPGVPKAALRHPKNGSVHKKKNKKFKDTSAVKTALKNGAEVTKESAILQKNGNGVGKSKKSRKSHGANSGSPRGSEKSPPTKKLKEKEEDDDDDDSGDDINEGISVNEVLSAQEDEVDDDDSSDDGAVPDIFGNSLAEETDDDDNEFDAVEDEKKTVNKGIKMFEGLGKVKKDTKSEEEDDDEEEEEEDSSDDDDEDDDDGDGETAMPGLAALLGESIKDESDDAEFEAEDDSDDDEEESDEEMDQTLNSSNVTSTDDDEDEDDEDEDDDDDDDSSPDLTTLLGNSLVDDSDDDDFEGTDDEDDEDEDMSDDSDDELPESSKVTKKQKIKAEPGDDEEEEEEDGEGNGEANESHDSMELTTDKNTDEVRKMTAEEKAEVNSRTIFVGNIPKDTKVGRLKSEFKQFGLIENLRIRGIIPENPKTPLKVAAITKKFHPKSTVICAFITFKEKESVEKALSMNGKKFEGNYLRVDHSCKTKAISDKAKSVFLGNVPFTIEDNEIWEAFKDCGKIESVRLVRDRKTGLGRGFGYINFKTADGAILAMDLNGMRVKNRELRVQIFTPKDTKKTKGKKRGRSDNNENASPKKFRTDDSADVKSATPGSAEKRKPKRSQGEKQRIKSESASPEGKFQGQTADGKKKQKKDKSLKKKQQMAAKLLAKPKKPSAN